jgi:hypothetical protein
VLASDQHTWGLSNSVTHNHFLNLVSENFLDQLAKPLESGLLFLESLLFVFGLFDFKAFLGAAFKLDSLEVLDLLDGVLVNWVAHEQNLITLLLKLLQKWRVEQSCFGVTGDLINNLLVFLHSADIFLEGDHLVFALVSLLSQKSDKLFAVLGIFVYSEFQVLSELLLELGEIFLVFCDLREHFEASLDDVLLNDLKDFVLLQHFSADVQRKVVGINYTLDEAKVLRDEFLTVVHNEDSAHIQLDVVFLLLGLEEVLRSALGGEEHSLELELSLNAEVLH